MTSGSLHLVVPPTRRHRFQALPCEFFVWEGKRLSLMSQEGVIEGRAASVICVKKRRQGRSPLPQCELLTYIADPVVPSPGHVEPADRACCFTEIYHILARVLPLLNGCDRRKVCHSRLRENAVRSNKFSFRQHAHVNAN